MSPTITPVTATERTPTTSYDVDIYELKPGDTWEAISREFYNDSRYAAGLQAYNATKGRSLQSDGAVDVPPIHVVKKSLPGSAQPRGTPAARSTTSTDPDWGSSAASRTSGEKTFRVPQGGMTIRAIARFTLGTDQRWDDIAKLNPSLKADDIQPAGTEVKLPPDARNPG